MTRKSWIVLAVVVAVAGIGYLLWKRGALSRKVVTPPAVGVRSAIGSNFFSVLDRMGGNIMSNLNAPEYTPVSAGPTNNGSPSLSQSILGQLRLVS